MVEPGSRSTPEFCGVSTLPPSTANTANVFVRLNTLQAPSTTKNATARSKYTRYRYLIKLEGVPPPLSDSQRGGGDI